LACLKSKDEHFRGNLQKKLKFKSKKTTIRSRSQNKAAVIKIMEDTRVFTDFAHEIKIERRKP